MFFVLALPDHENWKETYMTRGVGCMHRYFINVCCYSAVYIMRCLLDICTQVQWALTCLLNTFYFDSQCFVLWFFWLFFSSKNHIDCLK